MATIGLDRLYYAKITEASDGEETYGVPAPLAKAMSTRYRLSVTDTLNAISAYALSNVVRKVSPPTVPLVTAPKAASQTYAATASFLITTGARLGGGTQKVCVKIGTADWEDSVANPERFSTSGALANGVPTIYTPASLAPGSYTITFRSVDSGSEAVSPEVVRSFTVLTSPFENIIPNVTKVKASHIRSLRTAVNNVRDFYGLSAVSWFEDVIAGKTTVKNWPFHAEFEVMHKNGSPVFIAFEGRIGYGNTGEFKQTHCILQDITSQKAAEVALEDSEKKYRNIAENISDVVWQTDLDFRINYVSPSVEKLFGVSAEAYIGQILYDEFPEKPKEAIKELIANALRLELDPSVDKNRSMSAPPSDTLYATNEPIGIGTHSFHKFIRVSTKRIHHSMHQECEQTGINKILLGHTLGGSP